MITGRQYLAIGAGLGAAFLGYCVYFDQKRRSAPDFKQKLIEKRRQQKEDRRLKAEGGLPDLRDAEAVQRFFMEEVQTGESLLGRGDIEGGVEHLATAIAVCAQPSHLLQMLQQTLPNEIFELILAALPKAKQKFSKAREALIREMSGGTFTVPTEEKTRCHPTSAGDEQVAAMLLDDDEPLHECDFCNAVFRKPEDLRVHSIRCRQRGRETVGDRVNLVHTGLGLQAVAALKFCCDQCPMQFNTRNSLLLHQRAHTKLPCTHGTVTSSVGDGAGNR
uniref:C2H2-type domain-containing protein n=1 Tax=Macrostomum lignano TaxID=282301 RepID=A0A1I8GFD2_9PLAT